MLGSYWCMCLSLVCVGAICLDMSMQKIIIIII